MNFQLGTLFAIGVGYLLLLFLIAYATEREWIPSRLARHPLTYVLSLGVYATSWTFYGSVGFAQSQGYQYLTIYLGVTLAFLLTPVLLTPILRLTREYQLTSLADLFAFRYRSPWAGVLVTVFMLAGSLPYIALQIRAVTESLRVLTKEAAPNVLALGFCVSLILFAILFGARHSTARERHEGLVVAIAFESLVKLAALLAAGLFAVFGVFGGPGAMNQWLAANPQATEALYAPLHQGPWGTLLLLAFSAAFLLPRQFHMAFTENLSERALSIASWGFPLYLLLLNLAIPPILWAGGLLPTASGADYYALGIALHSGSTLLPTLIFIGGLSAASAMMIVSTLALSAMCLNHLLLPASYRHPKVDVYRWVLWGRRILIAVIIMLGYGCYLLLEKNQGLVQLGLISFVAVAQFLPGVAGLLYWRRATRHGFIGGLAAGALVWGIALALPLLQDSGLIHTGLDVSTLMQYFGQDKWTFATFWSLSLNSLVFIGLSLLTRSSAAEEQAAQACCRRSLQPMPGVLNAHSPQQFQQQLTLILGEKTAQLEVNRALQDLGLAATETHPGQLIRLRERIERNLSGLMGPLLAHMIVDERLQMDSGTRRALSESIRFFEQQLEVSNTELRGLAAQLDGLRRYHRQVLQDLPLGICSVDPEGEVVFWNLAASLTTGIEARDALGHPLSALPHPWSNFLQGFLNLDDRHVHKVQLQINGKPRWFNLHKASISEPVLEANKATGRETVRDAGGSVILIEDLTDLHTLEAELTHSERLASIGRLAAGVAHEIGNPVTGIACLAQNLEQEEDSGEVRKAAELILAQTRRISNIVHSLVSFSHGGTVQEHTPVDVELGPCVDEAVQLVQLSHDAKALDITNHVPDGLHLQGDRQRLLQVFVNLLSNACDASRPGQRIEVHARQEQDQLLAEVIDHGEGIPADRLEQVLEPFFTTKQPGEGTGLGLPLVYSIIQDHGGTLHLDSRPGHGTRVQLRLPLTRAEAPSTLQESINP